MAELQGLQSRYQDFEKRGVHLLAITVDPVQRNAEVVKNLELSYRVLADPQLRVIDAYGLRHVGGGAGHDIARPATFLVDEQGIVRWRNLTANYRMRPRPEEILAQLQD